jgi:hypothetical protein
MRIDEVAGDVWQAPPWRTSSTWASTTAPTPSSSLGPGFRCVQVGGLHSFTFQLNLSRVCHTKTAYTH